MSRNGSGTYSVVNTFVAGTTITASTHNANWSDIGAEITNSVAVDGQSTMTGALKAASGTVALPGITFGADTDSGLYRIGANNLGVAVNGAKVIDVATTGAAVTGTLSATGAISQNGFALLPVGLGPLPWSGTTAPSGWVLTGQTLSRTTYASLWAFAEAEIALGNTLYTNGDGSTTFTIASTGGRVLAGKEASASRLTATHFGGDSTVLGATGGSESHTILLANLPSEDLTSSTNNVALGNTGSGFANLSYDGGTVAGLGFPVIGTGYGTVTTPLGGSDTAMNVTQPTIITNFIIFAGV